jgi:tetratricopeptide (TPR) repeat protein
LIEPKQHLTLIEMDFENVFNQICSDVGNNVQENSRLFAQCDSDLKRVAFVLNLEAVTSQLEELRTVLKNVTNFKSSESATAFRNQGNICFQKKTNLSALQYYNKSIIAAPTNHGDELSLAFANRSAVLMDLKKWMLCLRDIALAFSYHYPTNLHYKLYERQGNCWLKLGNVQQASNSFKLAIKSLQHANLDQGKLNKIALNLEQKLSNLTISSEVICEGEMTVEKMEQEIWRCRETTPKLNREINPKLPCASMSIKMAQSPEKGRHLVANEDLAPGNKHKQCTRIVNS